MVLNYKEAAILLPNSMAGIYIHIPFCKQACVYCNFHFSTNMKLKGVLLDALLEEITLKSNYLNGALIQTIYFGGGTPSLLTDFEIRQILDRIAKHHPIDPGVEITFESNPDDLHPAYLKELYEIGINRLSIGIQSFIPEDMTYMHRAHTPSQSIEAVLYSQDAGFGNISVDLIYGVPHSTIQTWQKNLAKVFELKVQHLSCYALTIEPRTALAHKIKMNLAPAPDDEETISQLNHLMDLSPQYGFEQYEISNYSLHGFRSRHNSSYWHGDHYLGLGPSAHSYDGNSRHWNVANNATYIQNIREGRPYFEQEILNDSMKYNEYIMTSIRTKEGISFQKIQEQFKPHFVGLIPRWLEQGFISEKSAFYSLTRMGVFIADKISADLFI
ncbi:MAG: radical SAM family heme chaperone HemW [Saprospiraceae bacterium]